MSSEVELKACPFCGTNDLRSVWTYFGVDDTPMHVSIACNECLAELPPCLTEDEAIKAWNTRTTSSTRANGRGDEQCALELLALMYDKYENGVCVYEDTGDPDDVGNYMGNSFMLDADDESEIVDLLNRRVPRDVDANSKS